MKYKNTQMLYYITESMSVRPGQWGRTIFAIKVDVFRFFFHQIVFSKFITLNDRV